MCLFFEEVKWKHVCKKVFQAKEMTIGLGIFFAQALSYLDNLKTGFKILLFLNSDKSN